MDFKPCSQLQIFITNICDQLLLHKHQRVNAYERNEMHNIQHLVGQVSRSSLNIRRKKNERKRRLVKLKQQTLGFSNQRLWMNISG